MSTSIDVPKTLKARAARTQAQGLPSLLLHTNPSLPSQQAPPKPTTGAQAKVRVGGCKSGQGDDEPFTTINGRGGWYGARWRHAVRQRTICRVYGHTRPALFPRPPGLFSGRVKRRSRCLPLVAFCGCVLAWCVRVCRVGPV